MAAVHARFAVSPWRSVASTGAQARRVPRAPKAAVGLDARLGEFYLGPSVLQWAHDWLMTASSWSFPEREGALAQTASQDLPMLTLADTASRLLVDVIGRTPVPPRSGEQAGRDVPRLQHQAVWFMAIVATRAARACLAVVTVGYEDQGIGYTRLLTELVAAAEKVVTDHSGEYAQRWLEGKTTTGAKLTGQEFYELVSGPAHADVKAVSDWIASYTQKLWMCVKRKAAYLPG